jgi:hypothetical protein
MNSNLANFGGLAYNYLNLVKLSIKEMEKQGNPNMLFVDPETTEEEYDQKTSWNDQNIAIPLLFNFYHGLELIMKSILWKEHVDFPNNHNLSILLKKLDEVKPLPKKLIEILKKYIISKDNPFNNFFASNNTDKSVTNFHLMLKYPANTKDLEVSKHYDYSAIRDQGALGLERFKELERDISRIKPAVMDWMSQL